MARRTSRVSTRLMPLDMHHIELTLHPIPPLLVRVFESMAAFSEWRSFQDCSCFVSDYASHSDVHHVKDFSSRAEDNSRRPYCWAALIPGTSPEEIRRAFEAALPMCGGISMYGAMEDAEAYYQQTSQAFNSGYIFVHSAPPPGTHLNSVDIGKLTGFYCPTWPAAPKGHYFTWNFYIGPAGKGPESIIVDSDWAKQGIVAKVEGMKAGKWQVCRGVVIAPRVRVRVSYPDDALGGGITHELVFPPDPTQDTSIPASGKAYMRLDDLG
ncbi:hypothetical protein BDZ89DRAFT_1137937 [Hymenopellis radicata]|nr:hypothetical protein BDZ89DRAFT_1137937 [Hymenopellis radicata]